MPEKISILKESGETLNSNVVSVFLIPDTQKRYIITTENAVDPHGLTVLHVSEIVDGTLQKVATDDEWSSIKTIMRAIISGNVGTFKYLPVISSIKASGQYSRDISVSASASKQMIDNYAIGEKASEADIGVGDQSNAGGGVIAPQNMMNQPDLNIQPSTIFPTGNVTPSADNELMPGIAEVPNNMGINQNDNPMQPMSSVDSGMMNQPVNEVGVSGVSVNGVSQDPMMNQNMPMSPIVSGDMNGADNVSSGVQVAVPTQVVPSAQIVQEAQMPANTEISFNSNATPSFAPNASLDEVVAGAQQMFMEGVKSLVQTIQEKVYRDLYAKEAELKAKEAELLQKEQMLNNQMAMMNNGGVNMMAQNMPINQGLASGVIQVDSVGAPVDMNQNMMMNNQMAGMVTQQAPVNQMGVGIQSPMQMNGVVQNQPIVQAVSPMVSGPMNVSANNDVI